MAAALPGVWGIDLGQCALKAIRLQVVDGQVMATAFDYIEHPKILSQPDADPDQLTREALEQFLKRNQVRGDHIAISVPGQTGLARFVKLPPVEAKKIPDIVRFEAKQQIPFPLEEVVWDWQTLGQAGETEGFVENEIGLFAMKRDMVNRYLQAFKDVDVEVHLVQMAPLALCNFVTFDLIGKGAVVQGKNKPLVEDVAAEAGLGERNACVVVLDIGTDSTNLVVTDGEKIIWQRPIPIGGNHFTRALTKDMKLTFAKAEHLKRNATKAEDPKKIFQSLKPVFSDFVGELQRSLGFFTNTHRQAQIKRMLGLGNAFRLPGLQKFISQSLGIELDKLGGFRRLKGDDVLQSPVYGENVLTFGAAYGLALQGLGVTRLATNLLPQEIQMERTIRAKKPWVAAAAASILLGVGVFTMMAGGEHKKASAAAEAAKKADGVMAEHQKYLSEFKQLQDDLKKAREAAVSMMRGGQERANWAHALRYVKEALPQPDGRNVPYALLANGDLDPRCPWALYINENTKKASERLRDRDEMGLKEEINLGDLIQINLQGVFARFCDGSMPTNYFNSVKDPRNGAQELKPLEHSDWQKPPAEPGWAMEIRGYTYHKDGQPFVMNTFMENLRTGQRRGWDPAKKQPIFDKGVVAPLNDPAGKWIKLKMSHVAMFRYKHETISPGRVPEYQYIKGGLFLNALVQGRAGGAAGPGVGGLAPGAPPGIGGPGGGAPAGPEGGGVPQGKPRGDWAGLGTSLSGSGGGGGAGMGGPTGPGHAGGGGAGSAGPAGTAKEVQPKAGEWKRTEFIIVLYWVEPLQTEPDPVKLYEGANADSGDGSGEFGGGFGGAGGAGGFGGPIGGAGGPPQ